MPVIEISPLTSVTYNVVPCYMPLKAEKLFILSSSLRFGNASPFLEHNQ